jgi:hypothetical protein
MRWIGPRNAQLLPSPYLLGVGGGSSAAKRHSPYAAILGLPAESHADAAAG